MAIPVITSDGGGATARVLVQEGTLQVTTVVATGGGISYEFLASDDQDKFEIDSVTGALAFLDSPDWEAPTDASGTRVYVVKAAAINGDGSDTQTISVVLTNDPADDPAPPPNLQIAVGTSLGF